MNRYEHKNLKVKPNFWCRLGWRDSQEEEAVINSEKFRPPSTVEFLIQNLSYIRTHYYATMNNIKTFNEDLPFYQDFGANSSKNEKKKIQKTNKLRIRFIFISQL